MYVLQNDIICYIVLDAHLFVWMVVCRIYKYLKYWGGGEICASSLYKYSSAALFTACGTQCSNRL